jgi:hypothetical protein
MIASGIVQVDHHQFTVGMVEADTLDTSDEGSLIVLGPGFVTVRTGIAYGPASLSVELHDARPELSDRGWEVIEECSVKFDVPLHILTLDGEVVGQFDEILQHADAGTYRVRIEARGRDLMWDVDVTEPTESYAIHLWRAPLSKFEKIKKVDQVWGDTATTDDQDAHVSSTADQESETAPSLGTLAELGVSYIRGTPRLHVSMDPTFWGGRPPSDALLETVTRLAESSANAPVVKELMWLAMLDREALEIVVNSDSRKKDDIARWAAERAFRYAGLLEFEWVQKGIAALLAREPLPAPFDDESELRTRIQSEPGFSRTVAQSVIYPDHPPYEQWNVAVYALYTANSDTPYAVFHTLWNAVFAVGQEGCQDLLEDLKKRFPNTE